jgi:branched-chain amino acid transport system ATP-binding protein
VLKVKGLKVKYGDITALHDIDLHVEPREVVALLGSNGAGKTTLLRTVSGLHRPSAGTIEYDGNPVDAISAPKRVRNGLAHVPEGRRIFPGLTVMENLLVAASHWRGIGGSADADLEAVFELFPRLKERRKQLGWSLSGGEQQMLAIGRALMTRPRCLLLDEPSLGLAPMIAQEVYARIRSINAQGVTVLIVEQNTVLALSIASRAYVLENGRIVLNGAAEELADHPRVREAYLGA